MILSIGIGLFLILDYLANKFAFTFLIGMTISSILLIVIGFPISVLKVMFTGRPAKNWPTIKMNRGKSENDSKTD